MVTLNWNKIKNEYINGHISYRKLAEKHDVSFNTLKEVAIKEKWFEKRKEQHNKIATKTEQKTAEKIAEKESDLAADIHSAATELLKKINIAIEQTDLFIEKTRIKAPTKVRGNPAEPPQTRCKWWFNEKYTEHQTACVPGIFKDVATPLNDFLPLFLHRKRGEENRTRDTM